MGHANRWHLLLTPGTEGQRLASSSFVCLQKPEGSKRDCQTTLGSLASSSPLRLDHKGLWENPSHPLPPGCKPGGLPGGGETHSPHSPLLCPPSSGLGRGVTPHWTPRGSQGSPREICSRRLQVPRTSMDYCFINRERDRAFLASDWLQLAARHQSPGGFWVLIPGSRCWCHLIQRAPDTLLSLSG